MTSVALLAAATLMVFVFGTALSALGIASRMRLTECAARRGRESLLEGYDERKRAYAMTALLHRQLGMVIFVAALYAALRPATSPVLHVLRVVLISTAWLLLVAIALPSACARYAGERFLVTILPMLEALRRASRPLLWIVEVFDEIVRRLAGAPKRDADPAEQMEQQILDAVTQAEAGGAVDETEKAMIESVMVLGEITVGEIMTPRTEIVAVEIHEPWEEVRRVVCEQGHSRVPIYEETLDHVVGILYARDLLRISDPASFSARGAMRSVQFVPETKDVHSLLREFQAKRVHIAIVLDEYGGTAGLVTIEDILEELVGEIDDEHDDASAVPMVHRISDRLAEFDARVRLDEANEEMGISLPCDEAYDTLGGFVFSRLGRVPKTGEHVTEGAVRVDVVDADQRRVKRVRVSIEDDGAKVVA